VALAFVNRAQNTVTSAPLSAVSTSAASHTAGNLLVVYVLFPISGGASSVTLGDTAGNSYTAVGSPYTGVTGNVMQLFYKANCLGNAANVVTATVDAGTATYFAISVRQFSGAETSSVLESAPPSATGPFTPIDSGTVTVTASSAVIMAGIFALNDGSVAGSGYSLDQFGAGGSDAQYFADEYHIVTASESATATCTTGLWGIVAAAFKVAGDAGSSGFQIDAFQGDGFQDGRIFNPQSVVPGTLALVLTSFAPTITTHNESSFQTNAWQGEGFQVGWQFNFVGAVPGTLALVLTPFTPTVVATANRFVTPGTLALTLTPFVPTIVATANAFVVPDTLALVVTTFVPSVAVALVPNLSAFQLDAWQGDAFQMGEPFTATPSRVAKNYGYGAEVMPSGKFKWSRAWEQKFAEDRMLAERAKVKSRFEDFDAFVLEAWRTQEDDDLVLSATSFPW
jgi:hypothetical protein